MRMGARQDTGFHPGRTESIQTSAFLHRWKGEAYSPETGWFSEMFMSMIRVPTDTRRSRAVGLFLLGRADYRRTKPHPGGSEGKINAPGFATSECRGQPDADTVSPAYVCAKTGSLAVDRVQVQQDFFIPQFLNVRPALPMFAVKSPLDFLDEVAASEGTASVSASS